MLSKIFVDADSCSNKAKSFLENFAKKHTNIDLFFCSNKNVHFESSENIFLNVTDNVDAFILNLIDKNSLLVTRDLNLAKKIVKLNIKVMNDEGEVFNLNNIKYFTFRANLNLNLKIKTPRYKDNKLNKLQYSKFVESFNFLFFR